MKYFGKLKGKKTEMNNNSDDVYGDMPVLSPQEPMEAEENAAMEENEQNENVSPKSVPSFGETPKLPGKVRIIQIGRGKYRRQLISKPTARRLFGRNPPSPMPMPSPAIHPHSPVSTLENNQSSDPQPPTPAENSPSSEPPTENSQSPDSPAENPQAPATIENPVLEPKNFEGPGWDCLNIAQANGGRYYKAIRVKGQFLLQNILVDELEFNYPEQRLRALFGKMTNWIKKEAARKGHNPTHVILGFQSDLLNHSINLNVNALNADLTEIVLHWFQKIDQSGMMKHHKESLTTQQFEVDITTMELRPNGQHGSTQIGKTRQKRHPGSGRKPKTNKFKHNINLDALIQLDNKDNLCLFRSIEIARNKAIMDSNQFRNYMKSERRQKMDVDRLMLRCGIPLNLDSYSIEDYGDRIQKDYDEQYGPDKFRIFAFGNYGEFKPFWASKKENYQFDLSILYWEPTEQEEGHYDSVIYPGRLLGESKHYCFACLTPYWRQFEHDWDCAHKCRDCSRVGPLQNGGCQPDDNPPIYCPDCKKTFQSTECYDYHKAITIAKNGKKMRPVCQRHVCCEKCGDKYVVRYQTKNGHKHVCGERYCKKCGAYHKPRPCFIQPFEYDEGPDKRFVCHDAECSQDYQPNRLRARFKHEANMIIAYVCCTQCIKKGIWDKPLKEECPICGKYRTYAWSVADFHETEVDVKFITDNPTRDFTEWLLTNWKKKPKKIAKLPTLPKKKQERRPKLRANPFIDMEAECEDDADYGSSEEQDELQLLDQNFIADDDEVEESVYSDDEDDDNQSEQSEDENEGVIDEDEPRNALSGLMERIEPQNEENVANVPGPSGINVPGTSNSAEMDPVLAEKSRKWKEINDILVEKGLWPTIEEQEEARKAEEEEKRKAAEAEEEAKRKKEERKKNREVATYAYSHYGQKYDNVLINYELTDQGYCPKTIKQGRKFYQIEVRRRGVVTPTYLRDTYHLIPIKLEQFVPTFNLEIPGVEGKQFFPYKFNTRANMHKVLDHLPPKEDYCYKSMPRKKAKVFLEHYEANKNTPFKLNEVVASYCLSDVKILVHGLVKMREVFEKATGMDITKSITASGACMKFFRKFLKHHQLAMTPHMGYEKYGRSSGIARKHLKWLAHVHNLDIQDADSLAGEKSVGKWKVDGYVNREKDDGAPIAIEIFGCYWHGCRRCNPHLREEHFQGQKKVGEIWKRDMERAQEIRQKMHLWTIWECEIYDQLENNPEMEAFFDNLEDTGPINLRDAFMGGRTGPEWLHAKAPAVPTPEEIRQKYGEGLNHDDVRRIQRRMHRTIKVKDVKSLYPAINFSTAYHVGHPAVKVYDADVDWRDSGDIPYNDHILKVFVVPPRHVDIAALPNRFGKDSRLLFSLCRQCALKYKEGHYDNDYSCPHIDDKVRGHIGTYTSIELGMALDAGYRVIRHYRSYEWLDLGISFSDELFKPYIRAIMKIKYVSEGWPAQIASLPEDEQELAKLRYVEEAKERYGIEFTVDEVKANPGMKFISKLLLNSLWGRFALRNRLSLTVYCNNDTQIAKYLNDKRLEIEDCKQITERIWMITYKVKDVHVREHSCSNLILALWTTAAARVHLLKKMQEILKRPDVRILYYDTDSVFYDYATELGDPMENGQHLGEMTDQYPDHEIVEYVCLAPKFYSLRMINKKTGKMEYETKAKGFTIDCENFDALNHATMKAQLMDFLQGEKVVPLKCTYPDTNFRVTKECEIFTVPLTKFARPIINKGVVREDGRVMPFGWSKFDDDVNREYYSLWGEPNNMDRIERSIYED